MRPCCIPHEGALDSPTLRPALTIKGRPRQVIESHMAKEHVSMDELERALREHGIASYHDVALAVLEVDGSISCLKYEEIKPEANTNLVRHRRFLKKKQ